MAVCRKEKFAMAVNYAWEKLFSALRYAVGSTESPQERLASVVSEATLLRVDDLPNEPLWEQLQELIRESTKLPDNTGHLGTIHATTSQMTDDEAAKWLHEAFDVFSDVARAYGP
jgi:hypothetical protein